MKARSW